MSESTSQSLETRQYRRVPIGYQVKLVSDERIIAYSKAVNLSMGGILLAGPAHLPVGSHCGVAILFASPEAGRRVVARGTVVRSGGEGMAIAFSKVLDPESEESLRKLIHSLEPGAEAPLDASPEPSAPEASLVRLLDHLKPGSSRLAGETTDWEPPPFAGYEHIREWLKESVMSATMYERYPDGRWTIQLLLKEQNPGTYRYIVL